jgi:hypothetical protein
MTRMFAFFAAILVSVIAISSACTAGVSEGIRFHLNTERRAGEVYASFSGGHGRTNEWTSSFRAGDLQGLDLRQLRNGGPVRFALVRDAGRLDCTGIGGGSRASGTCNFKPNAEYMNFLVSRGVKRPNEGEGMALMSLNVRRDLVEALHATGLPAPSIDDLLSLAAIGADGAYIRGLAQVGYRPRNLDTLVQFKALDVTPGYIQSFLRDGYGNLPASQIVQLKALDITGDYVASFKAAGYPDLTPNQLTAFKALGVTADYARAVRAGSREAPSPDRLVELKAVGFVPR